MRRGATPDIPPDERKWSLENKPEVGILHRKNNNGRFKYLKGVKTVWMANPLP